MPFNDKLGLEIAIQQAEKSYAEGGIPIGACIMNEEGKILGKGHNLRIQKNSSVFHGETSALEDAGRLPAKVISKCTMYTTLSPCNMCSGAALLYKIKRIVVGENKTFMGAEDLLRSNGVEVVVMDDDKCKNLMEKFIKQRPDDWNEDIGEED